MIGHNNCDGNMTDIDKSYEVNFTIINKTLKLETGKQTYTKTKKNIFNKHFIFQ